MRSAWPLLAASERGGRIVLIGSGVTRHGAVATSAYATAKSALEGLASALKWEGGEAGILVNVVAPGLTVTEGNLERFPDEGRDRFRASTPSGRLSVADDVAPAVVFLGSPANTNITGAYLPVAVGANEVDFAGRRVKRPPPMGSCRPGRWPAGCGRSARCRSAR